METTAILIDGGFYIKCAESRWGKKSPQDRADELMKYCALHLNVDGHADRLYRIFYYSCPPYTGTLHHPIKGNVDMTKKPIYKWGTEFHAALKNKRKVTLRLGELSAKGGAFTLRPESLKKLLNGSKTIEKLRSGDFVPILEQKGVDMRIGLDISSMAHKQQVNRMILISGDSDFIPAAKHARREGIDFILDSMGHNIKSALNEHVDGRITHIYDL
jgi:Uncharacterized conserved protein